MRLHYSVLSVLALINLAGATASAQAMANPASELCAKMGGRSVSAKLQSGDEIGLCYLPGDKVVEEWTLYHMFDGEVPSEDDNPFN